MDRPAQTEIETNREQASFMHNNADHSVTETDRSHSASLTASNILTQPTSTLNSSRRKQTQKPRTKSEFNQISDITFGTRGFSDISGGGVSDTRSQATAKLDRGNTESEILDSVIDEIEAYARD